MPVGGVKGARCGLEAIRSSAASALGTPIVGWKGRHVRFLSVGGNYEDSRVGQFTEDVGDLVIFPVIPPEDPDLATGRDLGEHLERAIAPLLKAVGTPQCVDNRGLLPLV